MKLLDNETFYSTLNHRLAEGALCKTSLIVGPNGCGRGFAARILAAYHLCDNKGDVEEFLKRPSGEVMLLEGEGASGDIRIDRVREVRRRAHETSLDGKGRVIIVKDALNLNRSSANALLKIMEEPPKGLLFILTASSVGELPATVVSRCAKYNISPVSDETTLDFVKKLKLTQRERELFVCAFNGRLGSIVRFSERKKMRGLLLRAGDVVDAALKGGNTANYNLLSSLYGKGNDERGEMKDFFYCISRLFLAAAKGEYGKTDNALACYNCASAVDGAMSLLKRSVNKKAVLTVLCEDIKEAFNE